MNEELLKHIHALKSERRPFALATVINVKGSASARAGSKAVITETGKNIFGWVGGGCAESFVCRQSVEAMGEGRPRIVTADLDDEIFGLGMPCGGIMDVYIEPILPQNTIQITGNDKLSARVAWLAEGIGYRVLKTANEETDLVWNSPTHDIHDDELSKFAVLGLAGLLRRKRSLEPMAMSKSKGVHEASTLAPQSAVKNPKILILGSSRITEELARLSATLGFETTVDGPISEPELYPKTAKLVLDDPGFERLEVDPNTFVIIAAHHKGDHIALMKSLRAGCAYVSLVASAKRSKLVFEHVIEEGVTPEELARVRAPAGVELKCEAPAEIALSILTEILVLNGIDRLNLFQ